MEMEDDEIYAYEQEMREMDEWEEMHAHEMEAAEEELRAMEAAERAKTNTAPQARVSDVTENLDKRFAQTQERVQSVLERCAVALGETEGEDVEDTEMLDQYVARKEKATKLDATTAQFLLSRPPIDSDSMSIVLPSGERRFLRKRLAMEYHQTERASTNTLLPIADMMEIMEKRQIEAAIKGDRREPEVLVASRPQKPRESILWLDKYKPHRFVDLLSDEKTNREVLSWIKQWDAFVFPGKKSSHSTWDEMDLSRGSDRTGSGYNDNRMNNTRFKKDDFIDPNDLRPREKIILLCGPPGAGKTTLANIVARHAGYNPIEVNASDDRTSGVLKSKIINAMEMQSIWGDQKPNCIILDEIDGAMNSGEGKSAIAVIQEIISAPLNSTKDGKKKAGRQGGKHPLIRPLICICNDQYASVLRPLRKLAKIFVLDTPNSQRLISRLKIICRDEGIKSSTGALASLCSSGGNDIRYCVNALQFQSTQTKHITSTIVTSGLIGQKDHSRSVFETLDMVFYQPAKAKASSARALAIAEQIDEASHAMGNFPLLISALDENLPKMIFNDPTMSKICDAFEWMGVADSWDTAVRVEQQFALLGYIPFAARAAHLACCTSSRRRIEYPKTHSDASKKLDKTRNILQAFADNSHMHHSMRNSPDVLVVDVVPWLLATLSPNIRHLTTNLQSPVEKTALQRLIELMSALGLSYRPKYLPDGSEDYTLEPALHEIIEFRDPDNFGQFIGGRPILPLAVRKMITREVELEQMRRSEYSQQALVAAKSIQGNFKKQASVDKTTDKAPAETSASQQFVLPELSEQEQAEKLEAIRRRNPFAFAHREAKRKRDTAIKEQQREKQKNGEDASINEGEETDSSAKRRAGVRYRFNEGYTSGIKTPVYMRDLL